MKTTLRLWGALWICLVLLSFTLRAEPENVLVGDYAFSRPAHWVWQEPPKDSNAASRFAITTADGTMTKTDVRFYIVTKSVESESDTLLHWFPQASKQDLQQESFMIGKQKVIYFRVEGTYQFHSNRPRYDQIWLGAAIPVSKHKYVYARLLGPRNEVEEYIPTFRKMIEQAVREQQLN